MTHGRGARQILVATAIALVAVALSGCAFGETTPATEVTETSATLNGNVRSNLDDGTVWWFAWGETTSYGRETPHRTVVVSGDAAHPVAETLTGLRPSTTYHYRLCAFDPAHQRSGACGADRTVTTAAVGSYRDEVLADGPAGYWRLGESAGTTAASETGTNPGTYMNGVTLGRPGAITGDPSTAAGLDGIDDTVRVPSSPALGPTAGLTLEAWVDRRASSGTTTIVRKDGQYLLRLTPSGNLVFRLWHGSTATELTTAPNLVQPGRYQHVVATWDGAEMAVFVNATRRGTLDADRSDRDRRVEPLPRRQLGRVRLAGRRHRRGGGLRHSAVAASRGRPLRGGRRAAGLAHRVARLAGRRQHLRRHARRTAASPRPSPEARTR